MEDLPDIFLGICADTHGGALPRWDAAKLAAVLHAGDVYDAPSLIEDEDDPAPRQWVESLGVPVLAVRGNHDFRDPGRFFETAEEISGRMRRISPGLWVVGVGFAAKLHCDLPGENDLEPICRNLPTRIQGWVKPGDRIILLTHYPPKMPELPCGEVPEGWTYRCVADLMDELRPIAVVQGHVHDWFGRQWRRNDTLIVSPGPQGAILVVSHDRSVTRCTLPRV